MRHCDIDVSGTPVHQHLCTLHERRDGNGLIVLPVDELLPRYDPLAPPARVRLA